MCFFKKGCVIIAFILQPNGFVKISFFLTKRVTIKDYGCL